MIIATVLVLSVGGLLSACKKEAKDAIEEGTIGMQLEKPEANEEIAIMTTTMGIIKIRLFPKQAPKTVTNFVELAKKGYYDGVTFHRVIKDFMLQTGDPEGTGMGGESHYGAAFADEFSKSLLNIRGSLAMANAGANTNGSQFFINQAGKDILSWPRLQQVFNAFRQDKSQVGNMGVVDFNKTNDEYKKIYTENGGNPNLDGYYNANTVGHTVFGQVIEGMDVVDAIAAVEVVDTETNAPKVPVYIITVKMESFDGNISSEGNVSSIPYTPPVSSPASEASDASSQ